ncbi:MAG TPA: dihydroorotate dehydrogenase [Candidatus Omnitrophota bacterium]|nr:dihydroorotate dehydrogenase [Candidatus Omnitrophota bacterium]HPS21037.1 dihydroorotate dehydrogenase [Candidatus Omnitrophota bacterium]
MKIDMRIKIAGITFDNPVWTASGTFGYGQEFEGLVDLNKVGAIVAKTVTLNARDGNPAPRVVETPSGMLNSIGLENKGIDYFKKTGLSFMKKFRTKAIASIAGSTEEEFIKCAEIMSKDETPDAIEVNLSCPNVHHSAGKYKLFAQDPELIERLVGEIKKVSKVPVIVKLTPNVTDITETAKAAEEGGADAVSLVNTYLGMAVDAETMKPLLGNVVGGLSGPAIKPIALRAVREVYKSISIPIIGIGGIMSGLDVAEFMLCGARAVQVGTANFVDPSGIENIIKEFEEYLERKNIKNAEDIIGKLKV